MVHTQSTTEELQQVKKNLQRIYKDLDSAEQNNKMYEKQSHKEVDETINRALKNTSYTINAVSYTHLEYVFMLISLYTNIYEKLYKKIILCFNYKTVFLQLYVV